MKILTRCALQLAGPTMTTAAPAAFLWQGSRGIAWVEPAYLDPLTTRPAFHLLTGAVEEVADGLLCFGKTHTAMVTVGDLRGTGDALEWMDAELKARGSTWEREREGLEALLADALATIA